MSRGPRGTRGLPPRRRAGRHNFVAGLAAQQKKSAQEVERDFFQHAQPSSLLQRFEDPAEIAALVAFVASPRASGINDASLRVDGGVVRSIG